MRANGRARVSARSPSAFGICDRDGMRYNLRDLIWQYEWSGIKLQNTRFLVCRRCLDIPNEQLRAYAVPPDPIPVRNPRPDPNLQGNAMGIETSVTTVANASTQLMPADATRNYLDFTAPTGNPGVGLWLNPTGGAASPNGAGCQFIPAGLPFTARFTAAQSAMNYWCAKAGLNVIVESGS